VELDAIGMPYCKLHTNPVAVLGMPVAGGFATQLLAIPNNPSLGGAQFACQAFVVAPSANPLGVAATQGLAAVIGIR